MRFVCLYPAAGNAFCQAARLHMQLQNKHDSATGYIDAGNAFKKADPHGEATESQINSQLHDNQLISSKWADVDASQDEYIIYDLLIRHIILNKFILSLYCWVDSLNSSHFYKTVVSVWTEQCYFGIICILL